MKIIVYIILATVLLYTAVALALTGYPGEALLVTAFYLSVLYAIFRATRKETPR